MGEIRIAIVGVGNCASALIQGLYYYRDGKCKATAGLMHEEIGGYTLEDIKVVSAFDVDARKVGKSLKEAIFTSPNCCRVFYSDVADDGVKVKPGPVKDGVAQHMKNYNPEYSFVVSDSPPCDVVKELKESGAEILLNYLPVGSQEATEFYAEAALEAGVGFINNIPVFIASDEKWAKRYEAARLPIVGDDIKSQVGATITHRVLTKLFVDRGVKLNKTYQLNTGGNTDFLNMLERARLTTKKISKTEAVQSQLQEPLPPEDIHIGPSDYVPWQKDNKICFIRMEGEGFGGAPVTLELRLSVQDSPNSGGVVIDAIRCCKLALDRGIGGVLTSISSYTMKHPPIQYSDEEARVLTEEFIAGKRER
jgi:myo-inositol-1-phosphate synthase